MGMDIELHTVDSKEVEYWPGTIYAGVHSSLGFRACGRVMFQLSGLDCR